MASILLAVAVHEDNQAKLLRMAPESLEVPKARPIRFRIAYHFPDEIGEQAATLKVEMRMEGRKPFRDETAMSDRPGTDDSRSGDLWIELPSLDGTMRDVEFDVRLETLDRDRETKFEPLLQGQRIAGKLRLVAVS